MLLIKYNILIYQDRANIDTISRKVKILFNLFLNVYFNQGLKVF